ncbi:MAG: HAMP domain-containing sensor histidine kinase [Candidatus Margulisiibacteriota bacterium]|jgi:signal transduction histidine kinase
MKIEVRKSTAYVSPWWQPRAFDHWDRKVGLGNRIEIQMAQWSKYPLRALSVVPGMTTTKMMLCRLEHRIEIINRTMTELSQMPDNFKLAVNRAGKFYNRLMALTFAFSLTFSAHGLMTEERQSWHHSVKDIALFFVPTFVALGLGHARKRARIMEMISWEAQKELAQLKSFRQAFQRIGGVAHDLNNLLGGIMLVAGAPDIERLTVGQAGERFRIIKERSRDMKDIIKELLDVTRPVKISAEPLSVMRTINWAVYTFSHLKDLEKKRVVILINGNGENPQAKFDENKFKLVLLNLLINSYDALRDNGQGEIELSAYYVNSAKDQDIIRNSMPDANYVRIDVRDNGSGIPAEFLPKIFDFGETTKGQKGSGIGLAIVKNAIEGHKGFVTVATDCEPGKSGTTFSLYLPV